MLKRPKLLIGLLFFVLAGLRIAQHVTEYKNDMKPTGLKLVSATLNILTGILTLMSDALEQRTEKLDSDADFIIEDDFDLSGFDEADASVPFADVDCE